MQKMRYAGAFQGEGARAWSGGQGVMRFEREGEERISSLSLCCLPSQHPARTRTRTHRPSPHTKLTRRAPRGGRRAAPEREVRQVEYGCRTQKPKLGGRVAWRRRVGGAQRKKWVRGFESRPAACWTWACPGREGKLKKIPFPPLRPCCARAQSVPPGRRERKGGEQKKS